MKKLHLTFLVGCAVAFSSCATILSGQEQKINVASPGKSGVTFEVDGKVYKTPAVVELKREGKDKVIKVLDDDCTQKQVLLNKKINTAWFGNLLSGGVLGSSTDYFTGAMWKYDDNVQLYCK